VLLFYWLITIGNCPEISTLLTVKRQLEFTKKTVIFFTQFSLQWKKDSKRDEIVWLKILFNPRIIRKVHQLMKSQIMIQKKTCQTWYETNGLEVKVVFKLICTLRSKVRHQKPHPHYCTFPYHCGHEVQCFHRVFKDSINNSHNSEYLLLMRAMPRKMFSRTPPTAIIAATVTCFLFQGKPLISRTWQYLWSSQPQLTWSFSVATRTQAEELH